MANFLVGADDSSLLRKRTTWELEDALDAADDGDTIEIQEKLEISASKAITISKNITIQGLRIQNEERTILPIILAGVCVTNKAKVVLNDICIRVDRDKHNCLTLKQASSVVAKNVLFQNTASQGINYPIVYIEGSSNLELDSVFVNASEIADGNHRVHVQESRCAVHNSTINARISINHSKLTCTNSEVMYAESTAVFAQNDSSVEILSSTISGGKIGDKTSYACMKCVDSKLTLTNSTVFQPQYSAALSLVNTVASANNSRCDSATFSNSKVSLNSTEFMGSLAIKDNSRVSGKDIIIVGRNNGQINLYANKNSSLIVDEISFAWLSTPNIRLEKNVTFEVGKLSVLEHENEEFLYDENGNLLKLEYGSSIDYFGEESSFEKLNNMIGLKGVKSEIEEFIAVVEFNEARKEQGFASATQTLHSLFLGNPGTGKTTVARLVGDILYEKGVISKNIFVETSRTELVGQYIGQTAIKTRKVLESAVGGVLFIDEAYSLAIGNDKRDFGIEAINEILKFMEDNRDKIVIILAGYTNDMMKFLEMNEGLRSRIPNSFTFEDYSIDELIEIGIKELKAQAYKLDEEKYTEFVQHNYRLTNDASNGRWIRNLNEKLLRKLAVRMSKDRTADVSFITNEDLETAKV